MWTQPNFGCYSIIRCAGRLRSDTHVPQRNDQGKEHHHEGADLVQRCRQQGCVQPLHPDTGCRCHRDVAHGPRSPWILLVEVVSKSSQELFTVAKDGTSSFVDICDPPAAPMCFSFCFSAFVRGESFNSSCVVAIWSQVSHPIRRHSR